MRADIHIHSVYSGDCKLAVADIIERCRTLEFGAMAVVDHNSFAGSVKALALNPKDIIVLPGMEITTSAGHVLAYNVTEAVEKGLSVEETIDRIHGLAGIAVAPHPYRIWSGLGKNEVVKGKFDAIEVVNARSMGGSNDKAHALAGILNLPETGGSDAHSSEHIGRAFTVFPDSCRSADDLVKSILKKDTTAEGSSRTGLGSIGYGLKCTSEWAGRGFRRL
jgi:predicted metal-dependent phosphoesterase TrpH